MTLGQTLRDMRVNGGQYRRQREVAAEVGVPHPQWSQIEADRLKPSPEVLARAAVVLGGDPDELAYLLDAWIEAPPIDTTASICSGRRSPPRGTQ